MAEAMSQARTCPRQCKVFRDLWGSGFGVYGFRVFGLSGEGFTALRRGRTVCKGLNVIVEGHFGYRTQFFIPNVAPQVFDSDTIPLFETSSVHMYICTHMYIFVVIDIDSHILKLVFMS